MTDELLRVAVATDRPILAWQARCIDALASVPGTALVRWIQHPSTPVWRGRSTSDGALAEVSVPGSLLDLPTDVEGVTPFGAPPPEAAIDILLDVSTSGVAQGPLAVETWRFAYGPRLSPDPALTALRDYARGSGVTRVALVSEPTRSIIREGRLQTASWWSGRPLEGMLIDPAEWPANAARARIERIRSGSDPKAAADADAARAVYREDRLGPGRAMPRQVLEVAAVGRRMRGWVDVLARHHDWNIGLMQAPIDRMLDAGESPTTTWLPRRPGHFAADPFGIERDGTLHVLFEDFDHRTGRGSISHVAVEPDGSFTDPRTVLDPGVHASYPFLFEHDGVTFMLPETSASGNLVLYEAVEFPYRWRAAMTLLPGVPAVDATVVEYAGRWWMFATRADRGANQNLFIWHAPRPTGPWTEHAANPVKTDARSARPGGTLFVSGGGLYRPSQDNSRLYGGRLILNLVEVLTPTEFVETPVGVVEPRQASGHRDGLHTLSAVGRRTLVDANTRRFVMDALRFNVASKLPGH